MREIFHPHKPSKEHPVADHTPSPAAASLLREQAAQRARTPDEVLQQGLEETFPGSDPVSSSSTATGFGGPAASSEEPLVDVALADVHARDNSATAKARETLTALRAELESLKDRAVAPATYREYAREPALIGEDIKRGIRKSPITAVSLAAAIGFLWGITR
jgi:ElaB/YqjD/DUF883 family membrane-anchored ribosome-binding protein